MAKSKDDKRQVKSQSLLARILAQLANPALRTALTLKSEYDRLNTIGKRPTVHFEAPYAGQPILLLALFEKGRLRPDVERLIAAARRRGLYVMAINTLKLASPADYSDRIDCYIERVNYGRDFGSYKTGFLKLFADGHDRLCPRLLLANDSIFYAEDRLEPFLREMMETDTEVLGSTENFEIHYHLGSFFISMAGNVLRHPRFKRYWRTYRLSDVRPVVIKQGEMGLSKALKGCVTSPDQMRALYDSVRFTEFIETADDETVDHIVRLTRRTEHTQKRFLLRDQMESLERDFLFRPFDVDEVHASNATLDDLRRDSMYLGSYSDIVSAINKRLIDRGVNHNDEWLRRDVVGSLIDSFRQLSQIHQNAAILLEMGLPIVKLDLVYRGMANMTDVNVICDRLNKQEQRELKALLLSRPFGLDTLFGWRRAAFMNGLI